MGLRDYSILSPEQEQELKEKIEALWYLKDENGDWRYTGTQIARAIGFRAKEAPDNPYAYLEPERIYNYRRKLGIEPRREPRGYPHRYRNKQTDPIDLDTIIRKVEAVPCRDFNNRRKRAGFMLGFWGGFRNTENRLLTRSDFEFDENPYGIEVLRCNAFRLKKGRLVSRAEATYSVELILDWVFVREIAEWVESFSERERPWDVHRQTWWRWHKDVLGRDFYPHFQRENRITFFASDPRFSIAMIRAWTGLHLVTIENYISKSRRFSVTATSKINEYLFENYQTT